MDSLPEGFQLDTPAPQEASSPEAAPTTDSQPQASADLPEGFQLDSAPTTDYNSLGQRALNIVEGGAQGIGGPIATGVELGLSKLGVPGLTAEDQTARQEANPGEHGAAEVATLIGSSFVPILGEYSLAAKAMRAGEVGLAGAKAAGLASKIGGSALKGAIEGGIFAGSDEISKAMLGQGDQQAPVASALAHGAAGMLFGGTIGGAFGAAGNVLNRVAESRAGQAASKYLSDFGQQWDHMVGNPDPVAAVTAELKNLHQSLDTGTEYGLAHKTLLDNVPKMNDAIASQNNKTADLLTDKYTEMAADPDTYPKRFVKEYQNNVSKWIDVAHDPKATPADIFDATNELKKYTQARGSYGKSLHPLDPAKPFTEMSRDISSTLKSNLEDSDVWGKAGDLQATTNAKYRAQKQATEDLTKRFVEKVGGKEQIAPGKVATYVKQAGQPNAIIKQDVLNNFKAANTTWKNHISDLHLKAGLNPSDIDTDYIPTPALDNTLNNTPSPGTKAAKWLFTEGSHGLADKAAKALVGGAVGTATAGPIGGILGTVAGPMVEPLIKATGKTLASGVRKHVVPTILKALSSGNTADVSALASYADTASKGAAKIDNGIESLFQKGGSQWVNNEASERERNKVKKFIADGELNKQMQNQVNQSTPQAPAQPQSYAQGGHVSAAPQPLGVPQIPPSAQTATQDTDVVSRTYPEQGMMLSAAKGRVSNYLNSIRPLDHDSKLTFDSPSDKTSKNRSYEKAISTATNPLGILNHIKKGTIQPEDVKHLSSMYPEIYSHLKNKIAERATKAQLKGEKPDYKTRQGISMFLGAPLSSEMTPSSIVAAQSIYAQRAQANQQGGVKKGTSKLDNIAKQYETSEQAGQQRQKKDD